MTWQEVVQQAKGNLGKYCKGCPECNGRACRNTMPGPGAKGVGDTAVRNYEKWKELRINMDTITDNSPIDISCELFGNRFAAPFFAGPVGTVQQHYSDLYSDETYNDVLVSACAEAGIAAFTGDGINPNVMEAAAAAIRKAGGVGIPTIKPWNTDVVREKMEIARGAFAMAMDVDAAGLPFLKNMEPPAGRKSVEELRRIKEEAGVPFIVKGIMTVRGALKAKEAGADGIIVSNHGGRVLDQCPATAEVLPAIAAAVGKEMTVLVDGGIRSGVDILKALALGADGVVIARPFVTAVYGGGREGVLALVGKLSSELEDAMAMCGVHNLSEITEDLIWKA